MRSYPAKSHMYSEMSETEAVQNCSRLLGNIAKVTGIQCMIIVFSDVHVPHPSFFISKESIPYIFRIVYSLFCTFFYISLLSCSFEA